MANYCYFTMKAKGENTDKLTKVLQEDYHYEHIKRDYKNSKERFGIEINGDPNEYVKSNNKIVMYPRRITHVNANINQDDHLYRIFECVPTEKNINENAQYYEGYCAWSVDSCMFTGPSSYIEDNKNCVADFHATSLPEQCKKLGLEVEIYSEETGCCFQEHYLVNSNGEVLESESVEYYENYNEETDEYEPEGGFDHYGDFSI